MTTVRDSAFEVMRRFGMTTIFGNPGSTEVSFLTDLPADIEFVLGLHEGSAVGIASGYAIARGNRRSSTSTRLPVSATRSTRSPTRVTPAPHWSSSSASRTAGRSRSSRS